ncbi:HAMP domain-containing sensor histidine kinase [Pedobacter sp. SYP-B3415]|uniref:tetratricopeptide repeat-containing sensor histidine kinase n=1 Tax=Pedobacter sp. SYP-B3415 TaxID=2496641 RepID=UPI00101D3778|nr:HAMP domain-containing sensor histidine kinase [Pedobacter sp. SYP-B3415]
MKLRFFCVTVILLLTAKASVCSALQGRRHAEKSIEAYQEEIGFYRYYKPDSAELLARQAYARFEKRGNLGGMAAMLRELGMIDDNLGMSDDARQKYGRALTLYRRERNQKGEASVLIRIGVVELRKGNYDKAMARFIAALKINEALREYRGIVEARNTIGEVYLARKTFPEALVQFKLAEKAAAKAPLSSITLNMYTNFGNAYKGLDSISRAESYLKKGLALSKEKNYAGLHITLLNTLASVYAKDGQTAEAIKLQLAALKKSREIQNYLREVQTLRGLADNYKSDPAKQLAYLTDALKLAAEKKAFKQQIDIYAALSDIYKKRGDYKRALELAKQSYALADSLYYQSAGQRIANISANYEKEKSDAELRELRLLNSKKSLQQSVTFFVAVAILAMFVILAVYFFRVRSLNRKLTASNTVKDKLFSVLGHDLRAPFASIVNLLFLINDDDLSAAERSELIHKLSIKCNASLETLNNLLRWGEMQIKGIRVNLKDFDPVPVIERNLQFVTDRAEDKNITVENLVPAAGEMPLLHADPDHFDFVIRNLLGNALKFTQSGGRVTLSSGITPSGDICFEVADTGVGIPESRLKNLFTPGTISQKGTAAEIGTGLGLLLSQEFTGLSGGRLSVTSTMGEGSTFRLTLPAAQQAG